jgi:hypothetical protein
LQIAKSKFKGKVKMQKIKFPLPWRERAKVRGFFEATILILSVIFLSCSRQISEQDRLKAIVNEVAEASQKKEIDGIRKHISKSYRDREGNDYDGVRRVLLYHFIRAETVSVFVRSTDVEITGDTALVKANVILVRGKEVKSIKDIIPESAAGYRFEMIFKKENNDWKAINGSWQDVGVAGLL